MPAIFIRLKATSSIARRPRASGRVPIRWSSTAALQPHIRGAFNIRIISGDSSFPEMVLVHGVPAILSTWHLRRQLSAGDR